MLKRKRSKETLLKINGRVVAAVTIAGLSEIVEKSIDTLRRYERQSTLPSAPLMVGSVRYYPVELCKKLKGLIAEIPGNKKPDADLIVKINKLFAEERSKYA